MVTFRNALPRLATKLLPAVVAILLHLPPTIPTDGYEAAYQLRIRVRRMAMAHSDARAFVSSLFKATCSFRQICRTSCVNNGFSCACDSGKTTRLWSRCSITKLGSHKFCFPGSDLWACMNDLISSLDPFSTPFHQTGAGSRTRFALLVNHCSTVARVSSGTDY